MIAKKTPTRRPSRAEVERAMRDLQLMWRPPNPENENARRGRPGVDETVLQSTLDSTPASAARRGFLPTNITHSRVKRWLCQKLCGDKFFNRDASLEIDRLIFEIEKNRAEGKSD